MRVWPAVVLAVATLAAGPAATASTELGAPGCSPDQGNRLVQTMNGRISGCLTVGALPAGAHTVVVQQVLNVAGSTVQRSKGGKVSGRVALSAPREPAVRLTLSPASGGPGTTVTVTGRVSRSVSHNDAFPGFCWDGCADGLQYGGVGLRWISRRVFRARIVIPAAPWIEGDPVRVAPLASGSYAIGIQCLLSGKGCSASTEGSAEFRLRARAAPPSWCRTQAGCAVLSVSPGAATPGSEVRVSGYAPLTSVSGSDQPFVFQLQVLRGRPHGPAVDFSQLRKGGVTANFGHAALRVIAPPAFASLGSAAPLSEVSAGMSPIAADPAAPDDVAWCSNGAIGESESGVRSSLSTAGALPVLRRMGFVSIGSPGALPACVAVAPLGAGPGAVAVAFSVAVQKYGAPPFYDVALETLDGGGSWSALPVPPGATADSFGGFRYSEGSVEAVFSSSEPPRKHDPFPDINPDRAQAERTLDAGASWQPIVFGCPAVGPCLTMGPFLTGNCAMGLSSQFLLRSADGGARWSMSEVPGGLQPCGEAELAAISGGRDLLINSLSPYPAMVSGDGGASWTDVGLPRLPGEQMTIGLGGGPGGITLLPDGALLVSGGNGYRGGWELLAPGSRAWCAVSAPAAAVQRESQLSSLTPIGGELWWLTGTYGNGPVTVHQVSLASVGCSRPAP